MDRLKKWTNSGERALAMVRTWCMYTSIDLVESDIENAEEPARNAAPASRVRLRGCGGSGKYDAAVVGDASQRQVDPSQWWSP